VVGLKPTYGLVSRYGLVAFASSLDQVGPITKDVTDAAILLNVIAGHDEKDTTSSNKPKVDYTLSLKNDVKGLKIGVPKEFFGEGINEEVKQTLEKAIEKYKELGAIIEEFSLDISKLSLAAYYIIACAEASMISMSQNLHHKFDYNKIRILDLGKAYSSGKTKLYPASGLPVILGLSVPEKGKKDKLHIVQVIGHTKQDRMHYVIYDDSGFFLKNGLNYNGFVLGVGWEELKKFIKTKNSFLIYPIHEKVYIPYETFKSRFRDTFNSLKRMERENINLENVRYLLADNREVKKFLREDVEKGSLTEAIVLEEEKRLLETDMPHYLWVCEIPVKNVSEETEYLFFFANPTYSRVTMKNIFINKIPVLHKEQFGLLSY